MEHKELKRDKMEERSSGRREMLRHGHYEGMEPRRRQEMEDAGMINEDHRAVANMPQSIVMRAYPMTGPYMPEELEDNLRSVDRQMDNDNRKLHEHLMPKKV